jgi:hypothetical protein
MELSRDRPILAAAELHGRAVAAVVAGERRCNVGVLCIQGAFLEHMTFLRALGATVKAVRKPEDFGEIDGLVIPGGESTTMTIVAEREGMVRRISSCHASCREPPGR